MNFPSDLSLEATLNDAVAAVGAESLDLWPELFSQSPIALSLADESGNHIAINQAFADSLGYPLAELMNLPVSTITRPEDREWTAGYFGRLAHGEVERFETDKIFVRKDGSTIAMHSRMRRLRSSDGRFIGVFGAFHPVGARARVDDARLKRLLAHSEATVTIVDADGRVLETTGRYQMMLGYPPEFWEHRTIFELLEPGEETKAMAFRDAVLGSPGQRRSTELRIRDGAGQTQSIRLHAINMLDNDDVGGIVLTSINITEDNRVVEGLNQRTATAEAVVRAQTMLLATVSHELRNPLHALQGTAELLTNEPLGQRAKELADDLFTQLTGLTDITQDLLDTAQASAGTVRVRSSNVNLYDVIEQAVRYGQAMATTRKIDLQIASFVLPTTPRWVHTDPVRVRQILRNLIGNAVKFTARGSVTLLVEPVEIDDSDASQLVRFAVVDTGVGIPEAELDAIREPFVTGAMAGAAGGAGLGLSIVQRTTTALGGTLHLSSTYGQGSVFAVVLPMNPAEDTASPTTDPVEEIAPHVPARVESDQPIQVLVVEDNAVNQQLAMGQLKRLDMEATVVGSGEEAIALFLSTRCPEFSVVLMDHGLPGMDGIETMRIMRTLGDREASLPVICVTASASASERERFLEAGIDGFVSKPATLQAIRDAIFAAIDRRKTDEPTHVEAAAVIAEPQRPDLDADMAEALRALTNDFGDSDLVASLVDTFLAELPARLKGIVDFFDDVTSRKAAHTLKSSARLLGATELADHCERIECGQDSVGLDVVNSAAEACTAMRRWLTDHRS